MKGRQADKQRLAVSTLASTLTCPYPAGIFNRLLAKSCNPAASIVDIGIDFCITESNEPTAFRPGKESFARHTSQADCLEEEHRPFFARCAGEARRIGQHVVGALGNRWAQPCLSQGPA